jgi:exodeoxyribonuclease V gamma subunit
MFCLHVSNRGENLLAHLAAVFQADDKRDVLRPELFLVQSRGVEMMIRQFLADKFVSWGNYRFLYPMPFIEHLAKCLAMPADTAMFERDRLAWRLESLLRRIKTPEIAAFLVQEPIALKRYQLARQLADLFDQYQLMRPEMLAAWQSGRTATKNVHEEWQAELWRRLRGEAPEAPDRGELLRRLAERLKEGGQSVSSLPQRLSVFGLHTMPPAFLHCLNALSARLDVHLYLLSPCRHYWFDARRAASWRDEAADDTYHPLLVVLGQEGREFQALLEEMVSPDIKPTSYHFPVEDDKPTLLRQLQADILDGLRPPAGSRHFAADDSLRLASCFSRRREVEVLKDHILDFLEKNPDLHARDLIVMAPDIGDYLPFIAAIFHDIPHSIAGRGLGRLNRTLAIVLDFLRLLRGRCGWAAVLDLLGRQPLAASWQLTPDDVASLRQWTPSSGIRWGLDREHLAALSLPDDLAITWEAGLARMTLGFALGDGQPWRGIVPWDGVEGGDGHLLGRLHAFISLMRKKLHQFAVDCPLGQWSGRLALLLAELFPNLDEDGGDAGEELGEVRQILATLSAIPQNEHQEPVSLAVIIDWMQRQAETPVAGDLPRGRLTFCSMRPMRSIPFAGIFLLGLNDGDFPRRDAVASFNLLHTGWRLGDRSVQADDRYQFLEAILAARRTLYLSYVGKSAKKGDELPPSVVVGELLTTLAEDYGVRNIVAQHPLHPFDRRYFAGDGGPLFSYAQELSPKNDAADTAAAAKKPWWQGELAFAPPTVSLADWLEFAAQPQRYFFRRRFGLDLRGTASVTPENENFTVNPLENWQARREIFAAIIAGKSEAETAAKLAASGAWPLGGPGQALFQEEWQKMTNFAAAITDLDLGKPLPRRFFAVDCGIFSCQGMLAHCQERGLLLIKHRRLKGQDLLQGWLLALLLHHLPDMPQEVVLACADDVYRLRADTAPSLEDMAGLFVQGNRAPSALLVEPAFAWAKQEMSASSRKTVPANDKAEQELQKALTEKREPAWEKLFAHREAPFWQPEHQGAAKSFMLPIVARLRSGGVG